MGVAVENEFFNLKGNKKWFYSVPAGAYMDKRLNTIDIAVLYSLYMLSDDGSIKELGLRKLAKISKLSLPTLQKSIKRLEKYNWLEIIETKDQFKANNYKLIFPEEL